ncbi:MAG: YceI family protein [Candidatus Sulfotelmatobacter sp.]
MVSTASASAGVRYVIDTRASQFTVQAFADGLISAVAHSPKIAIREWTGEVHVVSGASGNSTLKVHVKSASLEVLDELKESDRQQIHRTMKIEVLETDRFPEIIYESSEVRLEKQKEDLYRASVVGKLSLHGVTNDHGFFSQVALGVDTARAYGNFSLRQSDYSIPIASIAGGTLKLQDELKFSFYGVARKQG